MVEKTAILNWLRRLEQVFTEQSAYLTQLDAHIGDADHGTNMARGFTKVAEKLPTLEEKAIGGIFKDVGMTLLSSVGGTSGPLYGTWFIEAGDAATDLDTLTLTQVAEVFERGLQGVQMRGKAQPEDKTMVDALAPAVTALKSAASDGKTVYEALQAAAAAAQAGVQATIPLEARKGRASYLGERSIGFQDPGATSTHLMIQAAAETWAAPENDVPA